MNRPERANTLSDGIIFNPTERQKLETLIRSVNQIFKCRIEPWQNILKGFGVMTLHVMTGPCCFF